MKNYYFISDAHLGCRAFKHQRTRERRLVNFLDAIKDKAEAVYMLGDIFDFWFEYKNVVPKGFTRLLGKISELTDMGVEVHFFEGNHDMWCDDYLEKECGVIIHRGASTFELCGKEFYLAHGHKLDKVDDDWKTRFMYRCFESHTLRRLAKTIHPRWFIDFGYNWARSSRQKPYEPKAFMGEDKEGLVIYAKEYLKTHPTINYFLFGHRHIEVDIFLNKTSRLMILGNWFDLFTYAVFDGKNIYMENYVEGETEF
mgnify:FL=1